jgi:nucleolar protein 56
MHIFTSLDTPSAKFGEALRNQVEERLEFYESGATPSKNIETMTRVMKEVAEEASLMEVDQTPVGKPTVVHIIAHYLNNLYIRNS